MGERTLKATKKQLHYAVAAGMTKQEIMERFGYCSIAAVNFALRKNFFTCVLKDIVKRPKPKEETTKHIIKATKTHDQYTHLFKGNIAQQDFVTGKGYNRIDELWGLEGLA